MMKTNPFKVNEVVQYKGERYIVLTRTIHKVNGRYLYTIRGLYGDKEIRNVDNTEIHKIGDNDGDGRRNQ